MKFQDIVNVNVNTMNILICENKQYEIVVNQMPTSAQKDDKNNALKTWKHNIHKESSLPSTTKDHQN